ncbi:hypothetical protein TRIP_B200151 [uncultured Desulfatiglans sp.]|nr:hypothetical protein TRIP_B200151 [uncultured Desulfatiglans sp.]
MFNLPKISIVVPSFNQGRFLGQTLESIFSQGYPALEVVVMDGGSSDDSVEIIQRFAPRLTFWRSEPDNGQTEAINIGARYCSGELIAWLNSDDRYWMDALWTVARAYLKHPGYGLYIGNGLRYSQSEDRYTPFCPRHVALNRQALIEGLDYILQPSTFFLRTAWEEAGGLDESLQYCMDWDIIVRIARDHPAVAINEFLSVSREYGETKTASGKMRRAIEILDLARVHSRKDVTAGALFYFLETLLDAGNDACIEGLRPRCFEMMGAIGDHFAACYGNRDGFPEKGDPGDICHLPFPGAGVPSSPVGLSEDRLPAISVVTPSYNQAEFLGRTLDSLCGQGYPQLEMIVIDGDSSDGSQEIIRSYEDRLSYWVSEPDAGPAQAINKGFTQVTGEIVGWLNSDDCLAAGALWEVGKAFAEDPELDMIYANALYIDEQDQIFLADHGHQKTGVYYGRMQPRELVPAYWKYVHAVPQPTVFFRRHLLERCGALDESYHFIFDFELFWRFMQVAKIRKIEKFLAFYRIHSKAKTSDWGNFETELYRFSRPWWPSIGTPEYRATLQDFLSHFMLRKYAGLPQGFRYSWVKFWAGLSISMHIGNPEKWRFLRPKPQVLNGLGATDAGSTAGSGCSVAPPCPGEMELSLPGRSDDARPMPERGAIRYRSFFCSFQFPRYPGYSGGEIRDFHILRHLLSFSTVAFFALYEGGDDGRTPALEPFVERLFVGSHAVEDQRTLWGSTASFLRGRQIPVCAMRYHYDVHERFPRVHTQIAPVLQAALAENQPDFLFVSPQSNPVAMALDARPLRTRLIMASYDVEAVRMRRLAESQRGTRRLAAAWEAQRAKRFEQENLALYDGIIAVSDLDKKIFIEEYGFPEERVLVVDNGVDPSYFRYHERKALPEHPEIVYTGSFTYPPNREAAWRLIRRIMPLVWQEIPDARLWVVGQSPGPDLMEAADERRVLVTGRVEDVRPYLTAAAVGCVPLLSGSGTKYKVLEAMSAGMPLVCSPIAAEALEVENGVHLLIRESDEDLARAIVKLVRNPEIALAMARNARQWVERRYAWEAVLPRLDGWLDALAAMPRLVEASGGTRRI